MQSDSTSSPHNTTLTSESDPSSHALKRRYLGLLPPLQVIEICLKLEVHAPTHVQNTVWPVDLSAAISSLQSQIKLPSSLAHQEPSNPVADDAPAMGSLENDSHTEQALAAPDRQSNTPSPPTSPPAPVPSTSTQSVPVTTPTVHPQPHAQPPYPHQPYGYAHPHEPYPYGQPSYPHAPYYASQPSYPSFPSHPPHPAYSSHPYPHYPFLPHLAAHPHSQPNPLFTNASASRPPDPSQTSADDLPSYEEMIVEALGDFGDPEGCAPKNLFSWMASRYPLQSNFRPSASQALQKAFKRGRLEKSNNGKYRLNALWEGGNTSRRATRRPQTHVTTQGSQGSSIGSPFTRTPLTHQLQNTSTAASPYSGYSYPAYQLSSTYPGYPGHPSHPSQQNPRAEEDTGEGSDAWQAAQNILNAINFGALTKMPVVERSSEDEKDDSGTRAVTGTENSPGHLPVTASMDISSSSANLPTSKSMLGNSSEERAELQAHLALLAAQLAEIAEIGKDTFALDLGLFGEDDGDGDDDDETMEVVNIQ